MTEEVPLSTDNSYQGNFTKHSVWNEVAINISEKTEDL